MSDHHDHAAPEELMWQGRFIAAKRKGRWEYVGRTRGIQAAVIVAVDDGHILLVEQYRVPLGRACLELPAGLVGDEQRRRGDRAGGGARAGGGDRLPRRSRSARSAASPHRRAWSRKASRW